MRKSRSVTTATGLVIPALKSLPVAALLLAGMTACSDENMPSGNESQPDVLELQSSALNVTTDPSQMPATVYNYGFGNLAKSRATDWGFSMPDEPAKSVYSGLDEYPEGGWWDSEYTKKDFKVTGEKTIQFTNVGQNLYITSGSVCTIKGIDHRWGRDGDAKIYVLPGATLNIDNGNTNENANGLDGSGDMTIYNYGTLTKGKNVVGSCHIAKITLYSATPIDQIPDLTFGENTKVYTTAAIKGEKISFINNSVVYANCKIVATKEIYFTNTATSYVGYMKAPYIKLDFGGKLALHDGAYVETDNLRIANVTSAIFAEEDDKAVLNAKEIHLDLSDNYDATGIFGNMNIVCTKWVWGDNGTFEKDIKFGAGINLYNSLDVLESDEDATITLTDNGEDDCAPVYVEPKDETSEEKPSLETIASVTNDHSHPISATCIQFNGDKAYVSWHERGDGIHGCVEVVENTPEGLKLLAYAEDKSTDYNHILFDGNRLLAVGHNDKHAIVGEIALTNGTFTQGESLNFVNLKGNRIEHADNPEFVGGDGNCIVRNGKYISVASYGGLHTLNSDLSRMTATSGAVPTTGSAKHLSLVGGKILELNLTERVKDAQSSPAELRLFEATDYTWSNPTVIASDITIAPVDGKNTIAIDADGSMYVCLGNNGVKKYSGTSCVATINEGNAPANGLCVDDKYLYVAFGKGLYIYAKNDLTKPVLKYTHIGRNKEGKTVSCNYVAVNGDLIYLAYGLDGYDVIRMNNR